MGCLSAIVKRRKAKEDKSKQVKEHLGSEESNGSQDHLHSKNELQETRAATRIQAVFRSFLARKVFHNLKRKAEPKGSNEDEASEQAIATSSTTDGVKGSVRFRELVEDQTVKGQAMSALNRIHSWTRIQDQIRGRRLCMVKEARIRQKKLENQLKVEAKLHELEVEWCGGSETMEEIISRIQHREEASMKRERALAYAFVHQWRANSSQYLGQTSFSLGKESWGWSWVDRWVAARPWEIRVVPNVKRAQTKQSTKPGQPISQPETKISAAENRVIPNENCKNRKTCSTHPSQS